MTDGIENLTNIQRQNDVIISLLARLVWTPEKLAEIVSRGKRNPQAYRKVYNSLDGVATGSNLASRAGVTQPVMAVALKAWQELGIVVNPVKHRIMALAKNAKQLEKHVSARTPKQTISVKVNSRKRKEVRVREIFIDEVDEFKRVKSLHAARLPQLKPKRLPEKLFKYGMASILGSKGKFQDWGGEKNDLYSSHVTIRSRRRSTAFAFKGPATAPPLRPAKLGVNGDQIQRLFSTAADVFFVQFEGRIEEAVNEQMLAQAIKKSYDTGHEVLYGVIGLEDSHRLRVRYRSHFTEANVPTSDG